MDKKVLCLLLSIIFLSSAKAQSAYSIIGNVTGLKEPSKVFLQYSNGNESVNDSTIIQNGKFTFKGKIGQPVKATLVIHSLTDAGPMTYEKRMSLDKQEFYLEKGKTSLTGGNLKTAIVKGGKTQKEYLVLQSQLKPFEDKMKPLSKKMQQLFVEKNEAAQKKLFPKLRAIRLEMNKVEDAYIFQHPDSYVSLDLVNDKSGVIDVKTFEPFFTALSERLRNTKDGKILAGRLAIAKKTNIGQPAIDFTQNDTKRDPFQLSSLKGKYVLVDFWASWCGPCRAENPNVVKAYNNFKDKNFEIVGVSLDDSKEPWLQAIKKDGLPWIHVSDLKGWQNEVAVEYDVKAVPQNFLIDPNGIIIAKNLRGEELQKRLAELIR